MKIIRNGQEFELTKEECNKIYDALDREYKKEDILIKLEEMGVELDDKDLNVIVDQVERVLGKNDSYLEAYWDSIESVIYKYEKYVNDKISKDEQGFRSRNNGIELD